MKTKLLRILRRVAYYKIGICYFKSQPFDKNVFLIGYRHKLKPNSNCDFIECTHTYQGAIERLANHRRQYILDYVRPRIKERDQKRFNKMLKKL